MEIKPVFNYLLHITHMLFTNKLYRTVELLKTGFAIGKVSELRTAAVASQKWHMR